VQQNTTAAAAVLLPDFPVWYLEEADVDTSRGRGVRPCGEMGEIDYGDEDEEVGAYTRPFFIST
jgi:hypothetical protein